MLAILDQNDGFVSTFFRLIGEKRTITEFLPHLLYDPDPLFLPLRLDLPKKKKQCLKFVLPQSYILSVTY